MKIAYVSNYKNLDVLNWSGLDFFISKSLEKQETKVSHIFTANHKEDLSTILKAIVYRKVLGKDYDHRRAPLFAKGISNFVKANLSADTEVVFSPSTIPIALLDTNKPKVFYTDATFAAMFDFYDEYSNFCLETVKGGNYLEQQALETSHLAIFSSEWAAKTAIELYNVKPEKVKVVPFGANVEHRISFSSMKDIIRSRSRRECNLLFIGVDWKRKRAELAINVAAQLNALGLRTTLHIIGLQNIPSNFPLPPFVVNHGFISKLTYKGRDRINNLFALSHFLIVPSKAETFGVSYCEANSFGVPAIATNVGGIPSIIKDNVNGKMFPLSATDKDYAEYILSVFEDKDKYTEFAYSSYREYASRLNWDVASKSIFNLIKEIM